MAEKNLHDLRQVAPDYQIPRGEVTYEDGITVTKLAVATYDFAADGGAQGDIGLGVYIPKNAVVKRSWAHVVTAVTSGGSATLAFKAQTAADLMAATAKASLTQDAFIDGAADATASNMFLTTAEREITATVGTADLTAGKVIIFVEYVLSTT